MVLPAAKDVLAPVSSEPANVNLLEMNSPASPDSEWSTKLDLSRPDRVSQDKLDAILWHSVYGADSTPPPPGPGAEHEAEGEDED